MREFKIVFTFLLFLSLTHYANSANFTSSFSIAPVQVLNVTNDTSTDKNFLNSPVLVPTGSNSSLAIIGWQANGKNYTFTRRIVDAYTFAPKGNDTVLFSILNYEEQPAIVGSPANGAIAIATVNRTNSTSQVFINVFPEGYIDANSSNFTQIDITLNTNTTLNYYFSQFFYQDGYFYLLYTEYANANLSECSIYLQGVSATNPNDTRFTSPLRLNGDGPVYVNVFSKTKPFARCGQHGSYNIMYCMWKRYDTNETVSVMVDLANKMISAQPSLKDSDGWFYTPVTVVPYSKHCAQILAVSNASSQDLYLSMRAKLSFIKTDYTLPYGLPSNMQDFILAGAAAYYGGWFTVYNQYYTDPETHATRSSVGRSIYQMDGSMNGTQSEIAYNASVISFLVQPNKAVYVLLANTTQAGGEWDVAYLAQLYGSTTYPPQQPKLANSLGAFPYISLVLVIVAIFML